MNVRVILTSFIRICPCIPETGEKRLPRVLIWPRDLNLDLFTSKFDEFIFVPNWTSVVTLVKVV